MTQGIHPSKALIRNSAEIPVIPSCVHYAGNERFIQKALALQDSAGFDFDVACDCEDGAGIGREREHARMIAEHIQFRPPPSSGCGGAFRPARRVGVRIHEAESLWCKNDIDEIVARCGKDLAFVTIPKCNSREVVKSVILQIQSAARSAGRTETVPVHVLIESPLALHNLWQIASLPHVQSLDFGLMDFVSDCGGLLPETCMRSPGQFEHPVLRDAKIQIAIGAAGCGRVPTHNVTTDYSNAALVTSDARRARNEFGFLRMWSIHPGQIEPIVLAMRPDYTALASACEILLGAWKRDWAPIKAGETLHDRASYRHLWQLVQRAKLDAQTIPDEVLQAFFSERA